MQCSPLNVLQPLSFSKPTAVESRLKNLSSLVHVYKAKIDCFRVFPVGFKVMKMNKSIGVSKTVLGFDAAPYRKKFI